MRFILLLIVISLSFVAKGAQLIAPVGVYSDHQLSYYWNQADSDTTWHYLWINDATGNIHKGWRKAEDICNEAMYETTEYCHVYIDGLSPTGRVSWWVREWSDTDRTKPWSNKGSYEVTSVTISADFLTSADEWSCTETYQGSDSEMSYKFFDNGSYEVTRNGTTTSDQFIVESCSISSCDIYIPSNDVPRTFFTAGPDDIVIKLSPQYWSERTTCERVPTLRNELF